MEKLIFSLVLVLTAGIISLITGRNKRQLNRIPEGMAILCQPPGKRYVLYAMGVLVFLFVMFFTVLFIMDGAPENARFMWGLCVAMAVLLLFVTILAGNIMARDCVYFDDEKIQIEKAFKKPKVYKWSEIRKVDGDFDNWINLYLGDGTKVLTAGLAQVNYRLFRNAVKVQCSGAVAGYYQEKDYEHPQKCILRYGPENFLLAGLGIVIFLLYVAILATGNVVDLRDIFLESDSSKWFSIWFAPVCGVASFVALFILVNTSVRYSRESMVLKYPLRRKHEICWRNIKKAELTMLRKEGKAHWKELRVYTEERMYKINLGVLTYGKDDFMTELFKMIKRYDIPCTAK